jgi:hypothetical protein
MVQKIKIESVREGMVLAREAKDQNGRVLLEAGQALTEKHIRVLKAWGVMDISIREEADQAKKPLGERPPAPVDPKLLEQYQTELKDFFRFNDLRHPAVQELFQICLKRKTQQTDTANHHATAGGKDPA